MTERSVRNQIGIFVIVANLAVVGAALSLYFLGGFLFEEVTTTVAILVPMFSVYTTAIIKSFTSGKAKVRDTSAEVTAQYVFIAWLFPVVFTVYLVAIVFLKAYNIGFASFEQFKGLLIGSEAVFGVYVGHILGSMFSIPRDQLPSAHVTPVQRS